MFSRGKWWSVLFLTILTGLVLSACARPTLEVIEKEVTRVVKETVVVEKEVKVTRVVKEVVVKEVEVEVTPTP
jgi:hypothetical protein